VRPLPTAGLILVGGGLAGVVAGIATRKSEGPTTCGLVGATNTCIQEAPDNTTANVAAVTGGLAVAMGVLLLTIKPADKVTVLQHEPHAEKSISPCIAPAELNLLLKLGPNRFTHITVDQNGQASADLPAHAQLPKGAELEIVVFRAPPVFSKALPKWTVVGHVHVPE